MSLTLTNAYCYSLSTVFGKLVIELRSGTRARVVIGTGTALCTLSQRIVRYRFQLRTLFLAITAAAILAAYVGSYYRLSRRGLAEAQRYGLAGFLYVPFAEI